MEESTRQKIARLLRPTHDTAGWKAEFESLDKDEALPILIEVLQDATKTAHTRSQAINMLGMLKDSRALDALLGALVDSVDLLRARAAIAIGQVGVMQERAIEAIINGLADEDSFVRECCAKVLGLMKRPEAIPALVRMRAEDIVLSNQEIARQAVEEIEGAD